MRNQAVDTIFENLIQQHPNGAHLANWYDSIPKGWQRDALRFGEHGLKIDIPENINEIFQLQLESEIEGHHDETSYDFVFPDNLRIVITGPDNEYPHIWNYRIHKGRLVQFFTFLESEALLQDDLDNRKRARHIANIGAYLAQEILLPLQERIESVDGLRTEFPDWDPDGNGGVFVEGEKCDGGYITERDMPCPCENGKRFGVCHFNDPEGLYNIQTAKADQALQNDTNHTPIQSVLARIDALATALQKDKSLAVADYILDKFDFDAIKFCTGNDMPLIAFDQFGANPMNDLATCDQDDRLKILGVASSLQHLLQFFENAKKENCLFEYYYDSYAKYGEEALGIWQDDLEPAMRGLQYACGTSDFYVVGELLEDPDTHLHKLHTGRDTDYYVERSRIDSNDVNTRMLLVYGREINQDDTPGSALTSLHPIDDAVRADTSLNLSGDFVEITESIADEFWKNFRTWHRNGADLG